jgi:hypothetical protein
METNDKSEASDEQPSSEQSEQLARPQLQLQSGAPPDASSTSAAPASQFTAMSSAKPAPDTMKKGVYICALIYAEGYATPPKTSTNLLSPSSRR